MTFVSPKITPALDYSFTVGSKQHRKLLERNKRHMTGSAVVPICALVMTFSVHFYTEHMSCLDLVKRTLTNQRTLDFHADASKMLIYVEINSYKVEANLHETTKSN